MIEAPLVFIRPPASAEATAGKREPKPDWLKVRAPGSDNYLRLRGIMRELKLNTVCEDAHCPNIGECWHHGTATFMILGDVCTRACTYCAVAHGKPAMLDIDEPRRVGEAVERMKLKYAVITSVDRDDQPDGGAGIFAETIGDIKRRLPDCRVEVLIPDFKGEAGPLETVLRARPDVLNHNTETIARLYRRVRPDAKYAQSMELLERAAHWRDTVQPAMKTKSGIMAGLGETFDEVVDLMSDLRSVSCDIMTIGQYLQPYEKRLPVERYVTPDEFGEWKKIGEAMGFKHVESSPLTRSSYHAREQAASDKTNGANS